MTTQPRPRTAAGALPWCSGLMLLIATSHVVAGDAVFFRSDRGLTKEKSIRLPDDLANPGTIVWRVPLGPGHATPCVWRERVFLTTYRADPPELATVALDRATGRLLWRQPAPAKEIEPFHSVGSPAAASPACDGEHLYVFFGSFGLLCYDLDGNLVWSKPMGPFQDEFGAASSPVIAGDKILLNQDHDRNNRLVAIDKRTGETVWEVQRDEFARSYATPIIWHAQGQPQVIVPGSLTLTAYSLDKGERLWWVNGLARIVNTTPAVGDDILYMASWSPGGDPDSRLGMERWDEAIGKFDKDGDGGIRKEELPEGNPAIERFFRIDLNQDGKLEKTEWEKHAGVFDRARNQVLAIRPSGAGDLTETHVLWKYTRAVPYVSSPLLLENTLFLVKDGGILTTLDAGTGDQGKQARIPGRGNYYASPVIGDGKCYLASQQGVVSVVSAERDWRVLSSHDFGEAIYATPVIVDGQILVRTDAALYCFAAASPDNQLTERERTEGWRLLFDGKTLAGWQTSDRKPSKTPVEDESLNPHKCGAYMLVHEKVWEDFQLQLDFRVSPGCNSGVFFRTHSLTPKPGRDVGFNGIEIAIDDGQRTGFHATGALYDLVPVTKELTKPTGQWNHLVLTCQGAKVRVEVNGQLASEADFDQWSKPGIRADGTPHKFSETAWKDHPHKGYIGLQDHGAPVWFRNIKARELKP